MMGRLDGKVAVITGAAGGMGREAALLFSAEGASVCVADVSREAGEQTASECREAFFHQVDVADEASVAAIIPFEDEEEAVRIANDSPYGLSGSIWTRDGARALRMARAIESGVLSVNSNSSVRAHTPFGGMKQSGFGRELGMHALDGYSEVKNVFISTEA